MIHSYCGTCGKRFKFKSGKRFCCPLHENPSYIQESKNLHFRKELKNAKIPCSIKNCSDYTACFLNRRPLCLYHYESILHPFPGRPIENKCSKEQQ